jgi:WD40 repeat protein
MTNIPWIISLPDEVIYTIIEYLSKEEFLNLNVSLITSRTIKSWESITKRILGVTYVLHKFLANHSHEVTSGLQLEDGKFASVSYDDRLLIWNMETDAFEEARIGNDNRQLIDVSEGKIVCMSSSGVKVWDIAENKMIKRYPSGSQAIALQDGRILALSALNQTVLLCFDYKLNLTHELPTTHLRRIRCLCQLQDGRIATGSTDTTIRIKDINNSESEMILTGHTNDIMSLLQLSDGRLVSASFDHKIKIWNVITGECGLTLSGHKGDVQSVIELYDERIASMSYDRTIRVWDTRSGDCCLIFDGHTDTIRFISRLHDGRLLSGSSDKTLKIWNPVTGQCEKTLLGHKQQVLFATQLTDGRLVSGSSDKSLKVWNLEDNSYTYERSLEGHSSCIHSITLLRNGNLLTSSLDKTMRVWNHLNGFTENSIRFFGEIFHTIQLKDGRIVAGSGVNKIYVLDEAITQVLFELKGHEYGIWSLVELFDHRIASGSADLTIRIWNLQTCTTELVLGGHTHSIFNLIQLTDGRLVSVARDFGMKVWNLDPLECVHTIPGESLNKVIEQGRITALLQLKDSRVATSFIDFSIRIWDSVTWQCTMQLTGHGKFITSLIQLKDGRLVSGGTDKTIGFWNLNKGWRVGTIRHANYKFALIELPEEQLVTGDVSLTIWKRKDRA